MKHRAVSLRQRSSFFSLRISAERNRGTVTKNDDEGRGAGCENLKRKQLLTYCNMIVKPVKL